MSLEAWRDENPDDAFYDGWTRAIATDAGWINPDDYSQGALAILQERERQVAVERQTDKNDDGHHRGELAGVAACYALDGLEIPSSALRLRVKSLVRDLFPWSPHWWKPKDRRANLVRAGALIAAEIDRLDRIAMRAAADTQEAQPKPPTGATGR